MEHQRKLFQQRGYSEDLLPKTQSQRTWKTFNYFTLWMGSVHNVPNYVMVGGFFILGLSTFSIMLAIILSAFFIAAVMVLNGAAGSKYGVPFAMILRASYGVRGALFPGLLRGGIAAIMWFGLQCYAGSLACLILIGKIWPGFLTLGGDFTLLGLSLPGLITFLLFWLVNVGIGFGGGKVLINSLPFLTRASISFSAVWRFGRFRWSGSVQSLTTFRAVFRKQKTVASCSWW